MDLSRLRSIVHGQTVPRLPPVPVVRELTYEPVGPDGLPLETRHELPDLDGAAWVHTPYGAVVVIDQMFPADSFHGRVPVEALAVWDPCALTVVSGRPVPWSSGQESGSPPGSPLFFDLETTGLSGGAGMVPFIVGFGYFEGGTFRTRQFLLQAYAAERALLDAVTTFVTGVPALVTYNGRTFDVPVMETRWLFHRMPLALEGIPHVDMLPPSRRLWRDSARNPERNCRLVALESLLCGVIRVGDVPGIEIPSRYFAYIRSGDARLLAPVLYHNRMDLLSLAALTARAQCLVRDGADSAADPAECLALGRLLQRRGNQTEAERCYRRAARHAESLHDRDQALHSLALLLRRGRRFQDAASIWRELVTTGIGRTPAVREAVEALAIHHEHRERDLLRAKGLAMRALQSESNSRRREAVRYRLARLERKIAGRDCLAQPGLPGVREHFPE